MHGSKRLETAEEVRAEWAGWASRLAGHGGFANRDGDDVALEVTGEQTAAYVSDGRWVANCPACNGGIAVWVGMPDGCCYDCGRVWLIVFPAAKDVARAEVVLDKRPGGNRHWRPDKGETVDDLKAENAVRGVDFTEGEVG